MDGTLIPKILAIGAIEMAVNQNQPVGLAEHPLVTTVLFRGKVPPFNPGEIAGFKPDFAYKLVDAGLATAIGGEQRTTLVETDPFSHNRAVDLSMSPEIRGIYDMGVGEGGATTPPTQDKPDITSRPSTSTGPEKDTMEKGDKVVKK